MRALSGALDELADRAGLDIPMHVDAASGGFLAPFSAPGIDWDFRLPRVKSINASGHKFGLAPLGVGWALWRTPADLPEELVFNVNYLGGQLPTFNLNFSRPGGPVVAQYYTFLRLGRTGFAKVHEASYEAARHIAAEVAATGLFEPLFAGDPQHGIPAATWRALDATAGFSLFDLAEHLRTRGWLVPAYTLPPDRQDLAVQRVLARHGFSMDMADLLLDDLHHSLAALRRRPPSRPLRAEEVSTFDHDATPAKP